MNIGTLFASKNKVSSNIPAKVRKHHLLLRGIVL